MVCHWACCGQARCETFNGAELRNLAQLAGLVDECGETYMRFGLEGGKWVILDRCAGPAPLPLTARPAAVLKLGPQSMAGRDAWGCEGARAALHGWPVGGLMREACCLAVCRVQAMEDAPRILQQHAITYDRSADLRCAGCTSSLVHSCLLVS